jgi:hypothetical protein
VPDERLDIDLLDDTDPFEIDDQAAHLLKHAALGIDDVYDVRPIGCYAAATHLADQYRRDR